ncbi:serine/threonine protein kinase [Fusarium austroafricanum]|uniref:non-specific serine/threonine protein kinase n=1 Tax=Fusarium austroafricanum TaxID=2364996 RepID=A0A8H4P862_9HYPO|nr:serine/threonine protein kinase [Fusarium austroafricanum]
MPDSTTAHLEVDSGYGESSNQSLRTNDGSSGPDDVSPALRSRLQPPTIMEQQRVSIRPIAKPIDEQTARRANDVIEQMSRLLAEHMAKSKRRFLLRSNRQLPTMSIRPIMLGTTIEDAKVALVIFCSDESGAHHSIRKFLRMQLVKDLCLSSDGTTKMFDVHIFGASPSTRCGVKIGIPIPEQFLTPSEYTLCGTPIYFIKEDTASQQVLATMGGLLQIDMPSSSKRIYGLTVAHGIHDLICDDHEGISTPNYMDESDDSSSTSSAMSDLLYHASEIEIDWGVSVEAIDRSRSVEPNISFPNTILKEPIAYSALTNTTCFRDWALFELPTTQISSKPNMLVARGKAPRSLSIPTSLPSGSSNRSVSIITRSSGIKDAVLSGCLSRILLKPGSEFVRAFNIELNQDSDIVQGDSGSWVVDSLTFEVYGHLVATDMLLGSYVIPLTDIIDDIRVQLGQVSIRFPTPQLKPSEQLRETPEHDKYNDKAKTPTTSYVRLCRVIRSVLEGRFAKNETGDPFATRGMVQDVMSRSTLERVYKSLLKSDGLILQADTNQPAVDLDLFIRLIEENMLQDFLAVLMFSQCSVDAAKAFVRDIVLDKKAYVQNKCGETPYLLPATEEYLDDLFSSSSDVQAFLNEQRPFCTIIVGGSDLITIQNKHQRPLPWVEETLIASGEFGKVYKVKVAEGHLTTRDLGHINAQPKVIARKDFICKRSFERNRTTERKALRDIFDSASTHKNIVKSFCGLVTEGREPRFSVLMPLADLDLQKLMEDNPEIPTGDTAARKSLILSLIGLTDGLDFLHSRMITSEGTMLFCFHFDLKPSKILVFKDHSQSRDYDPDSTYSNMIWKLSDFGMSRIRRRVQPGGHCERIDLADLFQRRTSDDPSQALATQSGRNSGTFLPQEAEVGHRIMNESSDVWSLGCIISVLFTYMEEGLQGLDGFTEANAVAFMLKALENKVLLIEQDHRCSADRVIQFLRATLKKYDNTETAVSIPPMSTGSLLHKHKRWALGPSILLEASTRYKSAFSRFSKQPSPQISAWRLDVDRTVHFSGCEISPDGNLLVYWSDKDVMLFTRPSGPATSTSPSQSESGSSTAPTESPGDQTLRCTGQHQLMSSGHSWRSMKLTNRYLIAVTTDESFSCYIFDVELNNELKTYSVVTLPLPGVRFLTVSPDQDSVACILGDKDSGCSLLTSKLAGNPSPPDNAADSAWSETTSRQDHADADLCLVEQRVFKLKWSAADIEHFVLQTNNEGYIVFRWSPGIWINRFTIQPATSIKQDLKLVTSSNGPERLFTDMLCMPSDTDGQASEVIVVAQARLFFNLKSDDLTVVAHPPIKDYRILRIATNENLETILALATRSGCNRYFVLDVKPRGPKGPPQLRKLAELGDGLAFNPLNFRVIGDKTQIIVQVTATTPEGQYLVYYIDLSSSLNT